MASEYDLMQLAKKRDATLLALYPDFTEYADNSKFHYWMDYAVELDDLCQLNYDTDPQPMIDRINKVLCTLSESRPEHHACVDAASTLESLHSELKGVFKYGA